MVALRAARHAGDDRAASTILAYIAIQKYNYNLCEWEDSDLLARAARKIVERYDCSHPIASIYTREARGERSPVSAIGTAPTEHSILRSTHLVVDRETITRISSPG